MPVGAAGQSGAARLAGQVEAVAASLDAAGAGAQTAAADKVCFAADCLAASGPGPEV